MTLYPLGLALVLLGGIVMTGVSAAQQRAAQFVDIGAMEPGQEPPGFAFWRTGDGGAAEWRVVADPTATKQKATTKKSPQSARSQSR